MSTGNEQDTKAQRKAELLRIISAPDEKEMAARELEKIERQEAEERETTGRKAAVERVKGISRAIGSVIASLDDDEQRVVEAATAYAETVAQLNARYRQVEMLKAESDALVDRFGVNGAKVPPVLPPNRRERSIAAARQIQATELSDYRAILPVTEQCEHRLRVRPNYSEVAGSAAYEIISAAGLRPFAPLNEAQQRIVEERQQEREQASRNAKGISTLVQMEIAKASVAGIGLR